MHPRHLHVLLSLRCLPPVSPRSVVRARGPWAQLVAQGCPNPRACLGPRFPPPALDPTKLGTRDKETRRLPYWSALRPLLTDVPLHNNRPDVCLTFNRLLALAKSRPHFHPAHHAASGTPSPYSALLQRIAMPVFRFWNLPRILPASSEEDPTGRWRRRMAARCKTLHHCGSDQASAVSTTNCVVLCTHRT